MCLLIAHIGKEQGVEVPIVGVLCSVMSDSRHDRPAVPICPPIGLRTIGDHRQFLQSQEWSKRSQEFSNELWVDIGE